MHGCEQADRRESSPMKSVLKLEKWDISTAVMVKLFGEEELE